MSSKTCQLIHLGNNCRARMSFRSWMWLENKKPLSIVWESYRIFSRKVCDFTAEDEGESRVHWPFCKFSETTRDCCGAWQQIVWRISKSLIKIWPSEKNSKSNLQEFFSVGKFSSIWKWEISHKFRGWELPEVNFFIGVVCSLSAAEQFVRFTGGSLDIFCISYVLKELLIFPSFHFLKRFVFTKSIQKYTVYLISHCDFMVSGATVCYLTVGLFVNVIIYS